MGEIIPLVSVLMPVFNGGRYLREAVDSILVQTFTDFEFIIIDDGSTDETWNILSSYSDPRIRLIRNKDNLGIIQTLNKGLALAQGVYIARMDADDFSLPTRFASQVSFMEEHTEIGVLGTGCLVMDRDGVTSGRVQFPAQHDVLKWCLCFYDPIVHPSVMMRREIVGRAGGYSLDMMHAEDYDLWRRLSCVTRLSNLQDVHLLLRKHEANVSHMYIKEQQRNAIRVSSLMISLIMKEEVSSGAVERLWDQEFKTVIASRTVAELVYKLYKAFVTNAVLSGVEKRIIRQDAAERLYNLVRPWAQNVSIWKSLARVFSLNPLLAPRFVKEQLLRLVTRIYTMILLYVAG